MPFFTLYGEGMETGESNHAHDHRHGHTGLVHSHVGEGTGPRRIGAVIALTAVIFVAELVGALVTGSLALLADAGHMLTDAAGLLLALVSALMARRAATPETTFGHRRTEVLAATVNAASVLAIAGVIAWEAVGRLAPALSHGHSPAHVDAGPMMAIAAVGLAANIVSALLLRPATDDSVNVRGAYLHVLADAAGSVAVLVSGAIVLATGWTWTDAVVSVAIALMLVPRSWRLLRTCLGILLEHAPDGADPMAIRTTLESVPGVEDVHDLHVWTISGTEILVTAHLVCASPGGCGPLDAAQAALEREHGVTHATLQIEHPGHRGHEGAVHA